MMKRSFLSKGKAAFVAVLLSGALLSAAPAMAGPATGLGLIPLANGLCTTILTPVGWVACAGGWTAVGIGWLPFWP